MKAIIILALILFFSSCSSQLVFQNPMPEKGKVVHELPSSLEGFYFSGDQNTYHEIQKTDENQWFVYECTGFHKDSMNNFIQQLETDSTEVKLRGNLITVRNKRTNITTKADNYTLVNDYYISPKQLIFEINFNESYVVDNFDNIIEENLIVKKLKNRYYLNIKRENGWYVIWLNETNDGISIHSSIIVSDYFDDNKNISEEVSSLKKINNHTYFAHPSDEEFKFIIDQEDIFYTAYWKKIERRSEAEKHADFSFNWMWITIIMALFLLTIILGLILFNKQKRKPLLK